MTPKEMHRILDAEITKAKNSKVKPERTNATIKAINAKLSYARFQFQAMRASGVTQDMGGLINTRPAIEGKSRRVSEPKKTNILPLKKKSA